MSVFNQMADSIPALAAVGSSVTSCAIFMSCAGLASNISSAAQAVSTADPAKIFDSARHFVLDPFADIANHASSGDWNGAGVASGHAAVGVVQAALAVSGICEAVMADSCFLPTIADVMDLVDAADAVGGADSAESIPQTLFRADTRGPSEIFDNGFQPKGSNMDLQTHVTLNPSDSGFVSTSKSLDSAQTFAQQIRADHVYQIRGSGIDVNATLGDASPYPWENEVAIPGSVSPSDIQGAWGPDGWIHNPRYGR
jgi:hypothetical protein